jgi:hypothetical protein
MNLKRARGSCGLFVKYAILIVGTTSIVSLVAVRLVERHGMQNAEQSLCLKATLVRRFAGGLQPGQMSRIQAEVDALHAEIHSRITFLDAGGNVLADSDADPFTIANLANQPEIVAASQGEDRAITRHSDAMGETLVFVARRVEEPASAVTFVRVADSMRTVRNGFNDLNQSIWTNAVGISFGMVVLFSVFLGRYPTVLGGQLISPAALSTAEPVVSRRDADQQDDCRQARIVDMTPTCLSPEFMVRLTEEIRASLAVIKASGETLMFVGLEDTAQRDQFLQQIDAAADHLHRLIADGLTLVEIASGVRKTHCEATLLEPVIAACIESHRASAQGHQLVLAAEAEASAAALQIGDRSSASPQTTAWADEEALSQLLDFMIENAIHWAPQGSHIRFGSRAEQDRILLSLSIAGADIGADDLSHIFDPFFRVDRTRTAMPALSGLGLAIASHLTRAMGGTMSATSQLGPATNLTVCLLRAV